MSKWQKGFLLIGAMVLLLLFGVTVVLISNNMVTNTGASNLGSKIEQAHHIADAGIQTGTGALIGNDISNRETCAGLSSTYSNTAFDTGYFRLSGTLYTTSDPASSPSPATLTSSLSSSATILHISSLSGYAPYGEVMLNREFIKYTGTANTNGGCSGGSKPCLTGLTRGVNGSTATSHANGTVVSQNQCHIVATAGVPDLSDPTSSAIVTAEVASLEQAWIVGASTGGDLYEFWNGKAWSRAGPYSGVPNTQQNGLSALSYSDVWAVGNRNAGSALVSHWNGSNWSRVNVDTSGGSVNQNLYGISCVNGNYCWAAGNSKTFVRWDGSLLQSATNLGLLNADVPNVQYNAISCSATNNCWAVGNEDSGDATFVNWDGSEWSRSTNFTSPNPSDKHMYGISCPSNGRCWAVGQKANNKLNIAKWNGSTWSRIYAATVVNANLKAVSCTSDNNCWAVGDKKNSRALIMHGVGDTWTRVYPTTSNNVNLRAVNCSDANNCWAVGDSGKAAHWNGSNWVWVSTINNATLYAVAALGGSTPQTSFWFRGS